MRSPMNKVALATTLFLSSHSRLLGATDGKNWRTHQFASVCEGLCGASRKKQKQRVENGVEISCLQVERENIKAMPHEICVNPASHEILRDEWEEPPEEQRKQQYSDYFDFGGHHYPRKLQLIVNGSVVITANVQDLRTTAFDQALLLPPKGATERRQCSDLKRPVPMKTPTRCLQGPRVKTN